MFVLTGINGLLFLAIPPGRFIDAYPVNMSLALGCSANDTTPLFLYDLDSRDCQFSQDYQDNVTLVSAGCGFLCYDEQGSDGAVDSHPVAEWPDSNTPPKRFRKAVFLRHDEWGFEVTCSGSPEDCVLEKSALARNLTFDGVTLRLNHTTANTFPIEQLMHADQPVTSQCGSFDQSVRKVTVNGTTYQHCRSQCIVETQRSLLCTNKKHTIEYNPQLTFWVYLLLRVMFHSLLGGTMLIFKGACLALTLQVNGDYGLQRIFGMIGVMIFSPISGALIDYFSQGQSTPDFRFAIHF